MGAYGYMRNLFPRNGVSDYAYSCCEISYVVHMKTRGIKTIIGCSGVTKVNNGDLVEQAGISLII